MQRDWIDYASAFGNLATFATLVFVLYKNYTTRKQIQDLSVLAVELQEQNRLMKVQMKDQVRPIFIKPLTHIALGGSLTLKMLNEGHRTRINSIKFDETHILFENKLYAQMVENGEFLQFIGNKIKTSVFIQDCYYNILYISF